MVWARLDDGILDNPKIAQVGVLGFALHVAAIAYSARNVLVNKRDGFIPRAKVAGLLPFGDIFHEAVACLPVPDGVQDKVAESVIGEPDPTPANVVRKLVAAGLWEEVDGGYVLHDYLEYNPGREEVLRSKAERAEAGRKGASKRWGDGSSNGKSHSASQAPATANTDREPKQNDSNAMANRCPDPDPDPDPDPLPEINPPPTARAGKAIAGVDVLGGMRPLPPDFGLTAERGAYAAQLGLTDLPAVFEKFLLVCAEKGKVSADWDATWRKFCADEIPIQRRARERDRASGTRARASPLQPSAGPLPANRMRPEDLPEVDDEIGRAMATKAARAK